MKKIFRRESLIVEGRFMWASIVVLALTTMLLMRLWYVQIYRGDYYRRISENNRIRRIEVPAPRGVVYDANGRVLLGNRPFYDLVLIPQYVHDRETTFRIIARLLHMPVNNLDRSLRASQGQPKYLPVILKRNLTLHEVAIIQSNKVFLPGIDVSVAPRRDYQPDTPSHLVGYLGEISQKRLQELNSFEEENPYWPGDLIGKQGIEARWERYLRGKRGYRLIQVDAFGRQSRIFDKDKWNLPEVAAIPGSDVVLTIDSRLQQASRDAFRGKYGAVIVMRVDSGEILAMVSEPGYDPGIYQSGLTGEEWRALLKNPFHPFLDKTTGAEYPPGSVYKPIIAMAGLEEKVINNQSTFFCNGSYTLGTQTFSCHQREGHGYVNLQKAMMKSCDVYFYHVGVELGVDRIATYAQAMGLGQKLGIALNTERAGLVPTSAWKKLVHRVPWAAGETPSVSIGQGSNLLTPMQIASMYATIANGGKVWRPHLVRKIVNPVGKTLAEESTFLQKEVKEIKPETFSLVRKALTEVVMNDEGTGKNARVPGLAVAGKTGSVQVVSLKKNRNQKNVSVMWREHAIFASFAPAESPEIVVVIVSEHDSVGGGGASAAPVAGKILNSWWDLKNSVVAVKSAQKSPPPDAAVSGPSREESPQ